MASVIRSWVLTNLFSSEISSPSPVREPSPGLWQSRGRHASGPCEPLHPSQRPEKPLVNPPVSPPERTIADLRAPTTACFSREARAGKAHAHISSPFWGVGVWGTFWRALCFFFTIVICLGPVVSSVAGWMKQNKKSLDRKGPPDCLGLPV